MRRWLSGVVAVEMVAGSLAVIALSGGGGALTDLGAPRDAEFVGGSAAPDAALGASQVESRRASKRAGSTVAGTKLGAKVSAGGELEQELESVGGQHISFKAPIDFATGAAPASAAFNAASGDQLAPNAVRVQLSDSVAVGDFNHDGKPDVAQTNVIAGTLSVFLGDGRGGFAVPVQYPVGVNPLFVVAGDLDRDGTLDLAVANFGSDDVVVLRGTGDGIFLPASFVPVLAPRNVAIGEFNGDGIPDLAVSSSTPAPLGQPTQGAVAVLTGSEVGIFSPAQLIRTTANDRPVNANHVAVGDFDDDGRDDLAVGVGIRSNAGDRQDAEPGLTGDDVLIFLNRHRRVGTTPEQQFSADPEQRVRVGAWPTAIVVEDLDGDTHADLAVLDTASGDVTTLLGNGKGRFAVKATNVSVGAQPRHLATGDFNDDGNIDLVTASFQASTVSVLQGNGDGTTFHPAVDFWSGDATTSVAVGDFNADGRADVVAGRLRNDHLALLLNDSPQPGDGVVIARDIPYGSPTHPTDDPFAAHHTLDVYSPPTGTPSFAGNLRPYPVLFFAHGGGGVSGDKSTHSYLMRSLALEGIVAVSTNYRLAPNFPPAASFAEDRDKDVAQAFRWTRDNIASKDYAGDPDNIFVSGYSAGGGAANALATGGAYGNEQRSIRAFVLVDSGESEPRTPAKPLPSLLVNQLEIGQGLLKHRAYSETAKLRGAESTHVIVPFRDHLTLVSDMALDGDPARVALIDFLRRHLTPSP